MISYGTINGNLPNIFRKAVSISLADGEIATIARIQLCTMMLVIIHLKIGIFHDRLPEEPGPKKIYIYPHMDLRILFPEFLCQEDICDLFNFT